MTPCQKLLILQCSARRIESMQQSSAIYPKTRMYGGSCRRLLHIFSILLLVYGTVSSLHPFRVSLSTVKCFLRCYINTITNRYCLYYYLSQRGGSPFVYRDRAGWPASLPYICKIRVSMALGTQSEICLHERVPTVKIWGSSKNYQNWTTGKLLKLIFIILHFLLVVVVLLQFRQAYLNNQRELRNESLCTDRYP